MKKCAFEGCTNEIQAWQTYCPQHYELLMRQQSGSAIVEEPPKIPQQKVAMPSKLPEKKQLPQFPQQTQPVKKEQGEGTDRERLVRKECLRIAVDLMIATEDLNKPYDELLGQIRQLVTDFYNIVTKEG